MKLNFIYISGELFLICTHLLPAFSRSFCYSCILWRLNVLVTYQVQKYAVEISSAYIKDNIYGLNAVCTCMFSVMFCFLHVFVCKQYFRASNRHPSGSDLKNFNLQRFFKNFSGMSVHIDSINSPNREKTRVLVRCRGIVILFAVPDASTCNM